MIEWELETLTIFTVFIGTFYWLLQAHNHQKEYKNEVFKSVYKT